MCQLISKSIKYPIKDFNISQIDCSLHFVTSEHFLSWHLYVVWKIKSLKMGMYLLINQQSEFLVTLLTSWQGTCYSAKLQKMRKFKEIHEFRWYLLPLKQEVKFLIFASPRNSYNRKKCSIVSYVLKKHISNTDCIQRWQSCRKLRWSSSILIYVVLKCHIGNKISNM